MGSKKVLERQKSLRVVESLFQTSWAEVRAALKKILGEEPDRLPETLLANLRDLMAKLVQADDEATQLEAAERARKQEMKGAADALRLEVLAIKKPLQLSYGISLGEVFLNVTSHLLRRDPDRLLLVARIALGKLEKPKRDVKMIQAFEDMGMPKPHEYVKHLRAKFEPFEEAHTRHEETMGARDAARLMRQRGLNAYNAEFPEVLGYLVHLCRIAGFPHWAKLLQPSRQEPGLLLGAAKRRRNTRAGRKKSKTDSGPTRKAKAKKSS